MNNLGQALLSKLDRIIDIWVEQVRCDMDIESAKGMTYQAIHNDLPDVLEAIATLLTTTFSDQVQELREDALEHGAVRANQGFDTTELVREYRILRNIILAELEPDFCTGSVQDVLRAVRQIDTVLDDAVLMSLESYVEQRLKTLGQVQAQLLLTNQELTRLLDSQQENLSHLAHELKTPLNAVIGFSSLLLQQQRQQLTQGARTSLEIQHIERVVRNSKQLLRLINNAVEAAGQTGQPSLTIESVALPSLVQTIIDTLEPIAQAKTLSLMVDCDRAPAQITTDTMRLQQIIINLVSNAIRYTDQGTVWVVCYTINAAQWAIDVRDTGRGISQAQQTRIFEPYFRVDDENDSAEGRGLGLAIVNQLVQLLQGKISLVSEVGEGSTFTVVLPLTLDSANR
ncbi:MAG: sensor histidine kinase [Leptolyngbya sp. SIO4C1]|nr:sensor histidine kinase [Leptolyngbya sp. SIO4C1]